MVRVELSEAAARELRERGRGACGLAIQLGPAHEQYQGPEWTPEDEVLAPAQRWLLLPVGDESFANIPTLPSEYVTVLDVDDFKVMVFFPPTAGVLKVQLVDAAIHVHETDA